ncbi:MSOX-like protein [Mya arenaria]|uniref:MSOX-like protein n=1 Tax=Mya arenaria TaxID=6604 RepID=A0ABY7DZM9_MYAAR|nr:MSOX-like protein [Mya arenaria]WAR01594.1 MSOX-like protein [Mya arenaria]
MQADMTGQRRKFDYIVVGLGGIGSAALYWLSRKAGADVLGIEQYELGHSNGGSQDHSRIMWDVIEEESGIQVVWRTGGLLLAKKGESDQIARQYADAMAANKIPYQWLSGTQLHDRYPQFQTDEKYVAVYQKDGGLVDAATGNAVHVQLARGRGASVIENCPVLRLTRNKDGAWINHVVGSIGVHIPVYVTQEQVTYLATPNMKDYVKDKFPIWIYHSKTHDFYGMPIHGNTGAKIGVDAGGPVVTPATRSFIPDPKREQACLDLLNEILPTTCLYTMPPDRNFVIDTCLLGKILSELALDGRTDYDIRPFTMEREALTDPDFQPVFFMGASKLPQSKKSDDLDKAKL